MTAKFIIAILALATSVSAQNFTNSVNQTIKKTGTTVFNYTIPQDANKVTQPLYLWFEYQSPVQFSLNNFDGELKHSNVKYELDNSDLFYVDSELVVFGPLTDFLGSNIKGNWQFDICYDIKNPSFSTKIDNWGVSTVAVVPEPSMLSFLLLTPLLFLRRR